MLLSRGCCCCDVVGGCTVARVHVCLSARLLIIMCAVHIRPFADVSAVERGGREAGGDAASQDERTSAPRFRSTIGGQATEAKGRLISDHSLLETTPSFRPVALRTNHKQ